MSTWQVLILRNPSGVNQNENVEQNNVKITENRPDLQSFYFGMHAHVNGMCICSCFSTGKSILWGNKVNLTLILWLYFVHYTSIICLSSSNAGFLGARTYSSCHWVRGRIHPRQVSSASQGCENKQITKWQGNSCWTVDSDFTPKLPLNNAIKSLLTSVTAGQHCEWAF